MLPNSVSKAVEGVNLTFQGGLVRVAVQTGVAPAGGKRGAVNEFSAAARRRLMMLFASLADVALLKCVFITLTYGADFPSPSHSKKHLKAFCERIRRAYPEASAVWRFDFQQRGAPHFHLVVFGLPFLHKSVLADIWGDVVGREFWDYSRSSAGRPPFTRIELMRSRRRLMAYVSKYVAKSGAAAEGGGFNLRAYLHDDNFVHPLTGELCGSVGRWWGVFNRDALPIAEAFVMTVSGAAGLQLFHRFRRSARHVWRGVSKQRDRGFTLFVGAAQQWKEYLFFLMFEGKNTPLRV